MFRFLSGKHRILTNITAINRTINRLAALAFCFFSALEAHGEQTNRDEINHEISNNDAPTPDNAGLTKTAQAPKRFTIDIASQRMDDALLILSTQTHTSIAFNPSTTLSPPRTPAVTGEFTVEKALSELIAGSGYTAKSAGSGYVVKAITANSPTPPQVQPTPLLTPPLEELFITGNKIKANALFSRRNTQGLDAETIDLLAITDLERVSTTVPGLDFNQGGSPTLYIRGVGIDDNTDLSDPLVKYYENGSYAPQLTAFMGGWHDMASIQVEPGPQNHSESDVSVGGHMKANFNEPQFGLYSAKASITAGSYKTQKVTGFANLGLTDQHALRFSGQNTTRDSYFSNYGRAATDIPGRIDTTSLRLQYRYTNDYGFNARVIHNRLSDNGTGNTPISLTTYLQDGRRLNTEPHITDIPMSAIDDIYFVNVDSSQKIQFQSNQVIASYGNNLIDITARLNSSAGTQHKKAGKNKGLALTEKVASAPDVTEFSIDQFDFYSDYKDQTTRGASLTLEFQGDRLHWHNRLSYSHEDLFWFWGDSDDKANGYMGGQFDTHYTSTTKSLYSELTYSPTTNQALTVGLRETWNNKQRAGIGILTENSELPNLRHGSHGFEWAINDRRIRSPNDFNDPAELDDAGVPVVNLSAEDLAFVTPREQWEAYNTGVQQWGVDDNVEAFYASNGYQGNNFYITSQNSEIADSAFDWQIHYAYDFTRTKGLNRIAYGTLRSATSNSGFNDGFGNGSYPTYRAEEAIALDFGYDAHFEKIAIKSGIFYYDYTNKIAIINMAPSHFDPLATGVNNANASNNNAETTNLETTNDFRVNIPKARSYGATIDILWDANEHWQLELNTQYLNAEYTEGELIDARMAPFSGFTNADPLRFNTPDTTVVIPDSDQGYYTHTYDIYDYIRQPEYQIARPGADLDGDGLSSHYYQTACTSGQTNVAGDGQCYTVLNQLPDIEHPVRDLKGNKMPRSPSWDIYSAVRYQTALEFGRLTFSLGMKYRSDYYLSPYNGDGYEPQPFASTEPSGGKTYDEAPSFFSRIPAHVTFDLAAKWQSPSAQPWGVTLVGKNLTNKRYFTKINNTAWTYSVETNTPRVFELTLEKQF